VRGDRLPEDVPAPPARLAPSLAALLAITFWGVSFVATKRLVAEISPAALIFARAGLGSLLLCSILAARGQKLPERDAWGSLAIMGFVGVAFHQMLQAYALTLTTAIHSGWLVGLTPIWSAVLSGLFLKERFGPGKLAGLALGFLGAAVLVGNRDGGEGFLAAPATLGDLLFVVSTLNWAVYTVLGHRTIRRIGALRATAGAMLAGWLMLLLPFVAWSAWGDFARLSATGWFALVFLGFACSGLGYFFWYEALDRMEASRVSAFLYLEPLVTLAAATALLHEKVTVAVVVGGVMLLAGVALVQRAPARSPARTSQ
jgi:drug/metabolite transporter (DMT)-like permease